MTGRLGAARQRVVVRLPPTLRARARGAVVARRHRGLRAADVLLVSYPKSGSSWLRLLISDCLTGIDPDFDSIRVTIPPIGSHDRGVALLDHGGRVVRSHEPLDPAYPLTVERVVYLIRDPRAVVVSFFHHARRMSTYPGDLDAFCADFVRGRVSGVGTWARHVSLALDLADAHPSRVLFVRYEELLADPACVLGGVTGFLGVEVDQGSICRAVDDNVPERMLDKERRSAFLSSRGDVTQPLVRARLPRETLSPPALRLLEASLGEVLSRSGYAS